MVQNAGWEGPGLIRDAALAGGTSLSIVRLFRDSSSQSVPFEKLEKGSYVAAVSLGSPSTAYRPETNAHHDELVEFFKLIRKRKVPSFNICYSMQLFSIVHGGSVIENPAGKEVGLFDVRLTEEGTSDVVFGPVGTHTTLQWHGDIVEKLPVSAVHLGRSRKTENQVAVLDGIHYLVEADGQAATPSMVRRWLKHDSSWALDRGSLDADDLIKKLAEKEVYFRRTFLRIFRNFLKLATSVGEGSRRRT